MTPHPSPLLRLRRTTAALLLAVAAVVSGGGPASALPTAEFTVNPSAPALGEPVAFTFRGTCDLPPCTVDWRWYQSGGSSLGTSMGTGPRVVHTFPSAGTYNVVAKITNAGSTHGSATASHSVLVQDTFEDHERRVAYDGWRGLVDSGASAGGYRSATGTGDVVGHAFTGTQVTYVARTGPDKGIASVVVAGVPTRQVDLYSARAGTRSVAFTGLTDAAHLIRVRPTGTRNPASTGTAVTVDGFLTGPTVRDDRASVVTYDSWSGALVAAAHGGSVRRTSAAGAATTFGFIGTAVTWLSARGPSEGRAAVTIDGRLVATLDGYAAAASWQVAHSWSGLSPGRHVLRVEALGTRDPRSRGAQVTSDAFVVGTP